MRRPTRARLIPVRSARNIAALTFALLGAACHGNGGNDTTAIRSLIDQYAKAAATADPAIASRIWSTSPDITFIEPLGNLRGIAQIGDFYVRVIGGTFTDRHLALKKVSIHADGAAAWSEFDWDFTARLKSNGAPFESRGSETQIYRREPEGWRIVHVHYSGAQVNQ